ncbi:MAG: PIN domain-containing protein [Treponema sp.]|nr:PIN domain-containing protein [Treponema sp.]
MVLLDTNAVLRFILKDVSKQHKEIVQFISSNPSAIRLEVLIEMIFVLEKYYKKNRQEIAHIVSVLGKTENLFIQYPRVVAKALTLFIENELDIVDCILCAFNDVMGYDVFTFDTEMKNILQRNKKVTK